MEEKKIIAEERRKDGGRAVAAREGAGAPKRFLGVELSMWCPIQGVERGELSFWMRGVLTVLCCYRRHEEERVC